MRSLTRAISTQVVLFVLMLTLLLQSPFEETLMADVAATPPGVSGTWKGVLSSAMKDGYLAITWTVFQNANQLSGRFVCDGGTMKCPDVSGTVNGTVTEGVFNARIMYLNSHLCGLVGTLFRTMIRGEYSCDDKLGEDRGTWRMTWEAPGPPSGS